MVPEFSLTFLKYLFEKRFNINFVVSQPPAKSGRGKKINLQYNNGPKKELKLLLLKQQAIVFLKGNFEYKSRFYCCVAYGKIIPEDIIYLPKYYAINIHASLLPRWRGAAPVHRAILSGDSETGVSIMKVEKNLTLDQYLQKVE